MIILTFNHQVLFSLFNSSRKVFFIFHPNVVSVIHGQNSICSKICLDGSTHEPTIISCRQLLFCRSHGGLLAIESKEKNVSNDNNICWQLQTIQFIHPVP